MKRDYEPVFSNVILYIYIYVISIYIYTHILEYTYFIISLHMVL